MLKQQEFIRELKSFVGFQPGSDNVLNAENLKSCWVLLFDTKFSLLPEQHAVK